MRFTAIALFLSSCAWSNGPLPVKFELPSGHRVICETFSHEQCGLLLENCGDRGPGEFDYMCPGAVVYYGPGTEWTENDQYGSPIP